MKYLYTKDKDMTLLIPVSTVRIYWEDDEIISVEDIASNDIILTIRCKNRLWAEQIMEEIADWLAKDTPNNNVFEIDKYDDR